jgi:hypothetical protein
VYLLREQEDCERIRQRASSVRIEKRESVDV